MVLKFNAALVIVTHNLGVVARYAQRIYVMYAGRIVESGTCKDLMGNPKHPYTIGLLNSVPRLDEALGAKLVPIQGMPPNLIHMKQTCAFLPRCTHRVARCEQEPWPALRNVGADHAAACYVDVKERRSESVTK
jgi:peptide/nickel transport system ATP-binding protein